MARRAIRQSPTTVKLRRERRRRITIFVLVGFGLFLLVLSRIDHPVVRGARAIMNDAATPILDVFAIPVNAYHDAEHWVRDIFLLREENARLRAENAELRSVRARAQALSQENRDLRELLAVSTPETRLLATARVIGTSSGAFVRSVLLSAGRQDGVVPGTAATTPEGLVGRVIEAGRRSARVLLLTDLNSRIPVRMGADGATAILAGRNDSSPVLEFLPPDNAISVGDQAITSGHGGLFPAGVPVGRVVSIANGEVVIEPHVSLDRLEFVHLRSLAAPAPDSMEGDSPDGDLMVPDIDAEEAAPDVELSDGAGVEL